MESFRKRLVEEGFEVNVYEQENFETAKFDVGTFRKNYDVVIYIGNGENASNKVTNRLSWYTFWGCLLYTSIIILFFKGYHAFQKLLAVEVTDVIPVAGLYADSFGKIRLSSI